MPSLTYFSIIVPTRNRPECLARCIGHILDQNMSDYMIHVVDDASQPEIFDDYSNTYENESRVRVHRVNEYSEGVGPAAARNYALQFCNSKYITFCDDDDYWTDEDHLAIAKQVLDSQGMPELYITNQKIIRNNKALRDYWNIPKLKNACENVIDSNVDLISIKKGKLLTLFPGSSAHVNMTICRTDKIKQLNGFWKELRYAEDLDFYLRLMDIVQDKILVRLKSTAVQVIPDEDKKNSASRTHTYIEQLLIAAFVMEHVLAVTKGTEVRKFALNYLSDTCKKISEFYLQEKKGKLARVYARASLNHKFSLKWFLFTAYLHLRP